MMAKDPTTASDGALGWRVALALLTVFGLFAGVGGWAYAARISGAVIAPGQVVVNSNVKKIQHSFGGIVETIAVKEGDTVSAGDLLIKLDATIVRANAAVLESQIDELTGRKAVSTLKWKAKISFIFPKDSRRTNVQPELQPASVA